MAWLIFVRNQKWLPVCQSLISGQAVALKHVHQYKLINLYFKLYFEMLHQTFLTLGKSEFQVQRKAIVCRFPTVLSDDDVTPGVHRASRKRVSAGATCWLVRPAALWTAIRDTSKQTSLATAFVHWNRNRLSCFSSWFSGTTYCTHSTARPFCMYSVMHRTNWSFSSSSCRRKKKQNKSSINSSPHGSALLPS